MMNLSPIVLQRSKDLEAIQSRVGKTVRSLSRGRFFLNEEPVDEDEGSLEIAFADATFLTLDLARDGESVRAITEPLSVPEPFDLDEGNRCSWIRMTLTDDLPWSSLMGSRLIAVDAVIDRWQKLQDHESVSGWILCFDTGDVVVYLNCGDIAKIHFLHSMFKCNTRP